MDWHECPRCGDQYFKYDEFQLCVRCDENIRLKTALGKIKVNSEINMIITLK